MTYYVNNSKNIFWGVIKGNGQNQLGRILIVNYYLYIYLNSFMYFMFFINFTMITNKFCIISTIICNITNM